MLEIREYLQYREEEILPLYAAVGWTAYTERPEALRRGFERSLLKLAAYEDGHLQGILRAVGDGETVVFVQDILVNRYSAVRQIELMTDNTPKTLAFYHSMGFQELSELGCCGFMRI